MSINGNFYPIRTERLAVCRGDKCRQTLANAKFNALRETSNGVNKKSPMLRRIFPPEHQTKMFCRDFIIRSAICPYLLLIKNLENICAACDGFFIIFQTEAG